MTTPESPFSKTTRLGLEQRLTDHFKAGDMHVVDELLDIYPTGRKRAEVALNIEHLLGRDREQDLINFRKAA